MNLTAIAFVLLPMLLAIITNVLLANRQATPAEERNPYLPPGWAIGTVWIILFGLLGYTTYLVKDNIYLLSFIVVLIAYCIAYPAITNFEPTTIKTRTMNAGAFVLASILILAIYYSQKEKNPIFFVIPLWIWATYVTIVDIVHNA